MYLVDRLFDDDVPVETVVWVSEGVRAAIRHYLKKDRRSAQKVLVKLKYYAEAGFRLFEGPRRPVKHEWDGVYRVGEPGLLFRIVGFYEGGNRRSFIAIEAFEKSGQNLRPSEKDRINNVANVCRCVTWQKVRTA